MSNEERLKRQLQGRNKWIDNNCIGIKEYATGVGKSFFATYNKNGIKGDIAWFNEKYPNKEIGIIVNSSIVKSQWNDAITKNNLSNIRFVMTIHQFVEQNLVVPKVGLLIADEVDAYTSQLRKNFINGNMIPYQHFLGLTATVFLIKANYPQFLKKVPIVDKITIDEAEKAGYISNSMEYNIGLELDEEEREVYHQYTKQIGKGFELLRPLYKYVPFIGRKGGETRKRLAEIYAQCKGNVKLFKETKDKFLKNEYQKYKDYYNFRIILTCLNKGAYAYLKGDNEGTFIAKEKWIFKLSQLAGYHERLDRNNPFEEDIFIKYSPTAILKAAGAIENALEKRARMLQNNPKKLEYVHKVLKAADFPETITFSESSEFADKLYQYLNEKEGKEVAVIYHSKAKVPSKDKDGNIRKWSKGERKGEIIYLGTSNRKVSEKNPSGISALMGYCLKKLDKGAKVLCAVKGVGRGFSRNSLRFIITTSYTESETDYFQNKGRVLRLKDSEIENTAIAINLYFRDTIEFKKLKKRQETVKDNENIIWVHENDYLDN